MVERVCMVKLFQCIACNSPFVAENEALVSRRGGSCPECARVEWRKRLGLPGDFLTRIPFA